MVPGLGSADPIGGHALRASGEARPGPDAPPRAPAPRRSAIVLAGGRSRRMGADKRRLEIDGRSLLERAVGAAAAVADDVVVVQRADDRAPVPPGAREAIDARASEGPLVGLEAGLAAARAEVCLVLAADHPALAPALLDALADALEADAALDAVVCDDGERPQPLLAAYRRRVLAQVTALLDAGGRAPMGLLDEVSHRRLAPAQWRAHDPGGRSLADVDTPQDLAGWQGGADDDPTGDER